MSRQFAVVDLFAGPGGLAEGFSSVEPQPGFRPFRVSLSVEKEKAAHRTLLLRTYLRQFNGELPEAYYRFLEDPAMSEADWIDHASEEWRRAEEEALQLELGTEKATAAVDKRLDAIMKKHGRNTVLIGGPPCQAYSLVGRSRNRGVAGYKASEDHRHFLYKEYIRILDRLRPAAFVMENVKGLLSSSVDGRLVFEQVLEDLRAVHAEGGGYHLIPLAPQDEQSVWSDLCPAPADFVVRCERFGIPQARHRVIIMGIRADIVGRLPSPLPRGLLSPVPKVDVRHVLEGMEPLRSGLSRAPDSAATWAEHVRKAAHAVADAAITGFPEKADAFRGWRQKILEEVDGLPSRRHTRPPDLPDLCPADLKQWLIDSRLSVLPNDETRSHMGADLARYLFAAVFADIFGRSPGASEYPETLAPDHRNWRSGKFADRFRVQVWDRPSTTVTSHISKDGHYYIHPDPLQCRSLTVREAARLQTFPDNYFFHGNRTQQYVQVGNAVPPFLARQIGEALWRLLETAEAPPPPPRIPRPVPVLGEA